MKEYSMWMCHQAMLKCCENCVEPAKSFHICRKLLVWVGTSKSVNAHVS